MRVNSIHPGNVATLMMEGIAMQFSGLDAGETMAQLDARLRRAVALAHGYGCGVAIEAPDSAIPIRTLHNISLNPNFGGEVMVVSLGCEKLQPERLFPPGVIPIVDTRNPGDGLDVVCLQDEAHVGFMSMVV